MVVAPRQRTSPSIPMEMVSMIELVLGRVKEFYMKANSLMKIKRANPVVTKVQREDEHGDMQVFDDRIAGDGEIAKYFTNI